MPVVLTDQDIARLLAERKPLPDDFRTRLRVKPKRGHKERDLDVRGANGSEFLVILRQADANAMDFSVILAYRIPKSNQVFRLRRYNGKHGEHTNKLEGQTFYGFHIHEATERYQDAGWREDSYAEPTDRYADLDGALDCLIADCGFDLAPDSQLRLEL